MSIRLDTELAPVDILALLRTLLPHHRLAGPLGEGLAVLLGHRLALLLRLLLTDLVRGLATLLPGDRAAHLPGDGVAVLPGDLHTTVHSPVTRTEYRTLAHSSLGTSWHCCWRGR